MIYARTELEEMPRSCFECPYGRKGSQYWDTKEMKWKKPSYFHCALINKTMTSTKRNRACPLVQDWLIEVVGKCKDCKYADFYPDNEMVYCLENACVMAFDGFCHKFECEVE